MLWSNFSLKDAQTIYAYLGLKEEINKIFSQAQRACTFDISPERNVWLQSALRLCAIVCDYMETALFAIVCGLRSAIVCDHVETTF